MDTQSCYMRVSMARASGVKHFKVFDWGRAARRIKEVNPRTAEAGLLEDWYNTSDFIWREGELVVDADACLASVWATPILVLDGKDEDCWRLTSEHPGSGGGKPWPTEALAIIEASAGGQAVEKAGGGSE